MLILAFEQSTSFPSMALVCDGRVLEERRWRDSRSERRLALSLLDELLRCAPGGIAAVDVLAVGLGPGSYTGLRMALVAARALALPDERMVYGVPSADVLAFEFMAQSNAEHVVVLGDARRSHAWQRNYTRAKGGVRAQGGSWTLLPYNDMPAPRPGTPVICSDVVRLECVLKRWAMAGVDVVEQPAQPTAVGLAGLAAWRMTAGMPSEPLVPIYLHGAVAGKH